MDAAAGDCKAVDSIDGVTQSCNRQFTSLVLNRESPPCFDSIR